VKTKLQFNLRRLLIALTIIAVVCCFVDMRWRIHRLEQEKYRRIVCPPHYPVDAHGTPKESLKHGDPIGSRS
jgi:hypothetical protein